ncbi:hypothetical protein [Weissella paramesenteroides]|uniref:hypothetical protein n=1 Tax=Weissella paramesenteroides TaxID=1249 RepID=UPI001238B10E|nr:hypothetical protein [Weissella paramesenteroides]KAA8453967.1 hypothetical protein FKV86_09540 [Weissella paramesenteroides]KAA8455867.1 hypothetical protein FKV78_09370 [Weissella paramesenteroides]KAA8457393.1 hypothetical protein FKV82_08280 [Weissella paramesenteroides]KAA8460679.1 hypothetical protein FKV85_09690 [Weissella paramesenteroides]KAA8461302.1 hypothetical protein FKV80_07075 [Weissella paramesenteroides]
MKQRSKIEQLYVANILSDKELIITGGKNKDIQPGDKFAIIDPEITQIKDPSNGQVLDEIHHYKDIVQVTHVYEKYSTVSAIDPEMDSQLSVISSMQFNAFKKINNHYLNVNKKEMNNILSKISNNTISVGDSLEKI